METFCKYVGTIPSINYFHEIEHEVDHNFRNWTWNALVLVFSSLLKSAAKITTKWTLNHNLLDSEESMTFGPVCWDCGFLAPRWNPTSSVNHFAEVKREKRKHIRKKDKIMVELKLLDVIGSAGSSAKFELAIESEEQGTWYQGKKAIWTWNQLSMF